MKIPASPHKMCKMLPECPLTSFAPSQTEMTLLLLPGAD